MRIKKKLSLLAIYCLIAFSLTSFISEAKASNVTRNIPLYYFNINNEARTINLTIQMSTATIQKGTIITVAGIPNDALGWADYGKQYAVEFEEKVDENTGNTANYLLYGVWGGLFWHTGQSYKNGIVTYTVAGTHPVDIYLGAWADDLEGGFDERYTIQIDGSISGTGLGNTEYEYYNAGYNEVHLSTFILNNNEFNALAYYLNNPDLQVSIGSSPQDLYNHWISVGKSEGRKAK